MTTRAGEIGVQFAPVVHDAWLVTSLSSAQNATQGVVERIADVQLMDRRRTECLETARTFA